MIDRRRHAHVHLIGAGFAGVSALLLMSAAALATVPSEYLVEVWDADRGMPSSAVTSIAATPDGYLWTGTFAGLTRFDGVRFTVTTHHNTPDFPDDAVTTLHVDRSGLLWAGTGGGIVRYKDGKWQPIPGPGGQALRLASHILETDTGAIYTVCGNRFYGLSGGQFTALPMPPKTGYLKVFAVPGEGVLGSAQQYFGRYRDGAWEQIDYPADLGPDGPLGAAPARANGVWIAGADNIRKYQDGAWSPPRALPQGVHFSPPVNLLEDSFGNVWAGDYRIGLILFRKDGTSFRFDRTQGLPNPTIRGLFEAPDQSVWAATDGGGLVQFHRRTVTMFDESDGLHHAVVDSVFESAPGSLLVGTYGGGLQLFDQRTSRFSPPIAPPGAGLTANSLVLSTLADRNGTAWAGTYARGVFRIQGGRVEQLPDSPAGGRNIAALFLDSRQVLWMGHLEGIAGYSGGRFRDHKSDPGAPQKQIVAIAEDSRGGLWAGGAEGLFHLHDGRFEKFLPPGIRDYSPVTALYVDSRGALWIGAGGRSLDRLQDGVFTAYGPAQGLVASHVGSILEDNQGRLWLATLQQGLIAVTRESLDAVAAGRQSQLAVVWLTRDAGLATNQLRSGFQPAAWKSSDGRLWFATLKGLALVDPRQVSPSRALPPVRIEDVTIGDRHIPIEQSTGDTVTVPPGSRHLEFSFTKPSFLDPERIRFQYGLEGLDAHWTDARERSAGFGDLRPGNYTFRVRATTDGAWNTESAALKVVVLPYYWETLWFRIAIVLALAALTGAAVYGRQNLKLKRKTEQLEKEQALRRDVERMQAVLRISEERFAKAFDSSPTPMSINTLDDGRFLDVNQRFLESTGFRREEIIGRRRDEVGLWLDSGQAARFAALTRANKHIRNFEARLKAAQGQQGYHLLSTEVIELDGQPCLLVSSDEITERRQLEEQLQQAQKLESIGRLAGGVAHDFNNLLTVINGYSDLIMRRLAPDDPNRERIDQVRKAGDRAAELTSQLLAFSRKQVIKPATLELNALIRDTEPMLRRLLPESIETSLRLTDASTHVMADPGQLNQVLINLAVNARDAMLDGGKLVVATAAVEFRERDAGLHPGLAAGWYILLAISDTGAGMSEEVRQHVFEPFFTTKKKGAGTGLGLATVYGIIRQSGGWISVESEPDHGATFRIYLPRVQPADRQEDSTPTLTNSLRGSETVLVVEDQENVRSLAKEVLESYGYRVLDAAHGAEALQLAGKYEGPIHLMLTDVVMPGMTGRELAGRMKSLRPATRVLYMSGYTEDVIAKQGVIDPGIAFIPKPLTPEALAAKVRQTLGKPEQV